MVSLWRCQAHSLCFPQSPCLAEARTAPSADTASVAVGNLATVAQRPESLVAWHAQIWIGNQLAPAIASTGQGCQERMRPHARGPDQSLRGNSSPLSWLGDIFFPPAAFR